MNKIISVESAKFPVSLHNIGTLTGYNVVNSERSSVVIGDFDGQKNILGVHSSKYSLIENAMLFDVIEEVLANYPVSYSVQVSTFGMMQFNIQVKFSNFSRRIGNVNDSVECAFNFRNGYDGKLKFGLHGVATKKKSNVQQAYRLSVYRQICTNGLHGWVDESISYDQYVSELKKNSAGKKVEKYWQHSNLVETKENLNYTQKHSGIDIPKFKEQLVQSIDSLVCLYQNAVDGCSNTIKTYDEMALHNIFNAPDFLKNLTEKIGTNHLPAKLHEDIIQIMSKEQKQIGADGPNAWLLYNGINRALIGSGKTIPQTLQADEFAFNAILEEVYA